MNQEVTRKFEQWKKKLIDLSKRNRLLNYRPTRASSVPIVDELPHEIFKRVAQQGSAMAFVEKRTDETPPPTESYIDSVLQTGLAKDRLDLNLLRIYRKASAIQEERGYNTLFLALGFLEWTEDDYRFNAPLLLVPAELTRKSARAPFRLRAAEEDPVVNPALVRVLRTNYAAELPVLPDAWEEEWDPTRFFAGARRAVAGIEGATVSDAIHLGLFSFMKFSMYKDLDAHAEEFCHRPLVRLLAGDEAARKEVEAPVGEALDRLPLSDIYHVRDADSSQHEAIEAVKRGSNLVLEGPPGTGKSQTITNIIAECLLAGKRVLFVSAKMAALRVVFDRLEQTGLGDFCLELHSHKASKRKVVQELGRVLELARAQHALHEDLLERTTRARDELNRYVHDLRTPHAPLALSPYDAFGRMAQLQAAPEVPVMIRGAAGWSKERFDSNLGKIRGLADRLKQVGPLERHPWRDSRLTGTSYESELKLRETLDALLRAHAEAERLSEDLAAKLGVRRPETVEEVATVVDLAKLLESSPRPEPAVLTDARWDGPDAALDEAIEAVAAYESHWGALRERYAERALDLEAEPMLQWWARHGDGFFRFLRPSFWKVRGELKGVRSPGASIDPFRDLDHLVKARRARRLGEKADGSPFGSRWKGLKSSADKLRALRQWIVPFRKNPFVSDRCRKLATAGFKPPPLPDVEGLTGAIARVRDAIRTDALEPRLEDLRRRAEAMRAGMDRLKEWTDYQSALHEVLRGDTADFASKMETVSAEDYERSFERQFCRSWLEEVLPTRPALARFDGRAHDRQVETFAELDRRCLELNRLRARQALLTRLPDSNWEASKGSDLGIIQRETRKKRGHAALRKLFSAVPRALERLKPCFMMSPLSLAQYLEPGAEPFDVVIFDEASQIAPEDAIGAVARGRQLVVVGDSRQLPPTPFFQVELPDEESGDDDIPEGELESVLDECATRFPERRMLLWHYRSRHEDLIAFSNHRYYSNRLFTFPAADDGGGQLGVELVHVEDGIYDRGGTGTNRVEAERVARAVFAHLKEHPDRSVGVGAFSIKQQQAIEDALERLRREDPSLEQHFDHQSDEFCFIKNLETIQGDERDVIILSIGYGRDPSGKVSMNFGPLNRDGGARRLNVLVTRAREKVFVYSSLLPEDIDLARTQAEGIRNLKHYLEYAREGSGRLAHSAEEPPAETPFEDAVAAALKSRGVEAAPRVGVSGYRIDLGIVDHGRYLLGIECDGPMYHTAATARDRDRLRRQVLESLGWRLHRIWSTDWFRSPERELDRALEAIERARAGRPKEKTEVEVGEVATSAPTTTDPDVAPYDVFPVKRLGDGDAFYRERLDRIAALLAQVVQKEGPIHCDEAARRVTAHWGLNRLGKKIMEIIASAAGYGERARALKLNGNFFWPPDMDHPPIRRRDSDDAPREAELIPPEEIAAAILLVLRKEYRARVEELIDRTARLLGFNRTGPRVRESVEAAVSLLQRHGRVSRGDPIEPL